MWTFRRAAAAGAAIAAGRLVAPGLAADIQGIAAMLLLVGAGVAVPLALALVEPVGRHGGPPPGRWRCARLGCVPAAVCLAASTCCAPGPIAGLLALPWFLFCLLVALLGVLRWAERGGGPAAELAIDAGLVFLAVGGAWTLASRCGVPLLGFDEPWPVLTAVHFHFAGLVLPVVVGLAERLSPGRLGAVAAAGVTAGVPAVAIGITAGARGLPTIEWLAAMLLVAAALAAAAQLAWFAVRCGRPVPAALLALAALALCGGMALVVVYATTVWLGAPSLGLQEMVETHAPLQVFGFGLPALIALHLLPRPTMAPGMQILLPWLGDVPDPQAFADRPFGPEATPGAGGVETDRHETELPAEPPGPPLPDGPFRRAALAVREYRAFPPRMIEGVRPPGPVGVGEAVVARYRLAPGLHLVFAARVLEVFDGPDGGTWRTGFVYRTLAGHPLCGVERFAVEKDLATGRLRAIVSAHSRSDTWLSRRLRSVGRRLQLAAGRAAVVHLRSIADRAADDPAIRA